MSRPDSRSPGMYNTSLNPPSTHPQSGQMLPPPAPPRSSYHGAGPTQYDTPAPHAGQHGTSGYSTQYDGPSRQHTTSVPPTNQYNAQYGHPSPALPNAYAASTAPPRPPTAQYMRQAPPAHNAYAAPATPTIRGTAQFTGPGPASSTQYSNSAPLTNFAPYNAYYSSPNQVYTGPGPAAQYPPAMPSYATPTASQYTTGPSMAPPSMAPYSTQTPAPQYANPIADSGTSAHYPPPSSNNDQYHSSSTVPPQTAEVPSYSETHRYANSLAGPAMSSSPSDNSVGIPRGHLQTPAMGPASRNRAFIHAPQTSRPRPYQLRNAQSLPSRRNVEGHHRSRGSLQASSQGAQESHPSLPQSLNDPSSGHAESVAQHDDQDRNSEQRAGESPAPNSVPAPTQPASNAGYPIDVDPTEPNVIVHDEIFKAATMKTEVFEHLWEKYYKGIWPAKEEFLLDLTTRYNSSSKETQKYIEAYIKADASAFYDEVMEYGWIVTKEAWGDEFDKDGLNSRPLDLKCRVNHLLHSQSFLHQGICGDEERLAHLNHTRVLYVFRKMVMIFQRRLEGLKLPTEPFSPGCLVLPCVLLAAYLQLYSTGEKDPKKRSPSEPLAPKDHGAMSSFRKLVIAVLKSNRGIEMMSSLCRQTHSLSSGLERDMPPDHRYTVSFYAKNHYNIGPYVSESVKPNQDLNIYYMETFRDVEVPVFTCPSDEELQKFVDMYCIQLIEADVARDRKPLGN